MKSVVFHLGDVTFDPTTRTLIHKDGRTTQLRNKSKDVLVYLLQTPNCTVPKAAILDSVWSDVTVSDESLVQCIADIRRIIGVDARHIIETVPREGYRVNLPDQKTFSRRGSGLALVTAGAFSIAAIWMIWPDSVALPTPQVLSDETGSTTTVLPGTEVVEAYLEVLQGRVSSNRYSQSESLTAERHFRQAIELDPNYARAYGELGTLLAVRFENEWTVIETADREKALFYAERAISLDPDLWLGHYALGRLHSLFADFDLAEHHLERAMSLQPDNEDARAYYGVVKNFQGESENAVAILEQAVRSHPNPPYWYYFGLGNAAFNAGLLDKSETALNGCLDLAENSPYCLRYLIAVHGEKGDMAGAEAASLAYTSMGFTLSIEAITTLLAFHHPEDLARLQRALHQAGVPD